MRSHFSRFAFAYAVAFAAVAAPAASAQTIDQLLQRQAELCAQSGGYLTAMGCQRGSGGSGNMPGMMPPAPPPKMSCTKRETTTQMPDGSTVTKSTEDCSSF